MKKYLSIFRISLEQEFVYKLNFVMWRVRNIVQILIFFFLWNAVFEGRQGELFGYDKSKILTYAFLLIIIRAVVLASKSTDVAGQIAGGELSNFLVKPVNYFKYWMTRDLSSKILNISFSLVEITTLFIILQPDIYLQTNILNLFLFLLSLIIGAFLFFCLLMLTNFVPFWSPESAWGAQFLVIVIVVEFLSGAFFPLDVFPELVFNLLKFTPFPYLIFVPIKIYLGADIGFVLQSLLIGSFWAVVLWKLMNAVWLKGLKVYEGVGR